MSAVRMGPFRRPAGDELEQPLPPRPRRRWLTRGSAAMAALLTCAIGFYAGIRVEKNQLPSSSATGASSARGGLAGLLAARRGSGGAAGAAGASTGGGAPTSRGGIGAAGAGTAFGTVSTVDGRTLYVTEPTGNTVKIKLTSSTKVSKTRSAKRSAIRPGDAIVVQGIPGSGGTVTAASVTDSGARAHGSGGSSATGSGSSSSSGAGSAIGSLFSKGG